MFLKLIHRFIGRVNKSVYFLVILLLTSSLILSGIGVWYYEVGNNEQFNSGWDVLWWLIVTSTTVGYGDKFPITTGGRIVSVFTMLTAIGFLSIIIGASTEYVLGLLQRRTKGMTTVKSKNHIVICGYSHVLEELVSQLQLSPWAEGKQIVLITDRLDTNPFPEQILFVKGSHSDDSVLIKAGIVEASTVIILSETIESPDSISVLSALSCRRLNKNIKILVELDNLENTPYLTDIGVTDIVSSSDLVSRLLTHTDVYQIIKELISNDEGVDASKLKVPDSYIDKQLGEVITELKTKFNITIIAIVREGRLIGNPQMTETFKQNDFAMVIADDPLLEDFLIKGE